jgi:hypothetical protein
MVLQDDSRYEDDDGEVQLTRRFVGKFRPDTPRNSDHAQGFETALKNALDVADRALDTLNVAGTFQANVTFEAEIIVGSPGNVGEYKAIVTQI